MKVYDFFFRFQRRFDKGEILDQTVKLLASLKFKQQSHTLSSMSSGYKNWFKDCARETVRYLSLTRSSDTNILFQLNDHLQNSYLERKFPSASYPAEGISAHVDTDTPKTISVSNNERFHLARVPRPSKYTNSEENSIQSRTCNFIGYEQFNGQHCYIYNQCIDRDNSRNSEENSIPDFTGYGQFYGQQ